MYSSTDFGTLDLFMVGGMNSSIKSVTPRGVLSISGPGTRRVLPRPKRNKMEIYNGVLDGRASPTFLDEVSSPGLQERHKNLKSSSLATESVKTLRVADGAGWRAWLDRNHSVETEVWLLIYKKRAAKKGISYDEAVEEALCYGWIDSAIKRVDEESYAQRFTPRKPGSSWSDSNLARLKKLASEGRMAAPGLAACNVSVNSRSGGRFFDLASLRGRRPEDERYSEFLRVGSLSSGIYVLKAGGKTRKDLTTKTSSTT